MSCTFCNSDHLEKNFLSWVKVNYSICKKCGCHYQDPIVNFDYSSDNFWTADTEIILEIFQKKEKIE